MALDAAVLALLAKELKAELLDAKIDKIGQPTRDEAVLTLRTRTATRKLLLSARSGSARAGITTETFENPDVPPSFCMLLRKHLIGGRLLDVRTVPSERILFFDFQCVNEMGDLVRRTLAAELMGRYSNLVLIREEDKIVDALKRVDFEDSAVRQLLPGLTYTLPEQPDKLPFLSAGGAAVVEAARALPHTAADALMKSVTGIGPVLCREAVWRTFGAQEPQADAMTQEQAQALAQTVDEIIRLYHEAPVPTLVFSPEGKPTEFSFLPLTQYLPRCELREYPDFSSLLDDYYRTKDRAERLRQKSRELSKQVHNLYDRALRKQTARREELAQSEKSDHLRLWGELISANLWQIPAGVRSVTLNNYYTGEDIAIPLDPRWSPSQNAQRYFKEYKKKQTAVQMLTKLLEESAVEIEYLATVLDEIGRAEGERALNDIRMELKGQGYLKYFKLREKKQKPADYIRYRSSDGFEILVGRNNLQNDKLTLHTARGKDLWFHTKNAPGSHTVVMSEGRDIPDTTKNEAAMIAVWHSSQKNSAKVAVDYTEVRNIRKTGDLRPGMVLYEHYETAYITPDETAIEKLLEKA
ncbi:MAG: NFACT family protein [Oscillospiraceae bacterium]|nr:NFACT family protein [Oscillospiraceae bacterium]